MCTRYDSEGNTIYSDARDAVDRLREGKATLLSALKVAMAVFEDENLDESHDGEAEVIRAAIEEAEAA